MQVNLLGRKEVKAYLFLGTLVICGLAGSLITAPKIVHFGLDFPFSNIVFSLLTYPIVDCICELWGKKAAQQTIWLGLLSQALLAGIIQLSIFAPPSAFWHLQSEYQSILSMGGKVVIASLVAFAISQILDVAIYQKIKQLSRGKWLWLRSNISTYLGQTIDSIIFINIIFYASDQKLAIICGSVLVKIILSLLMTPVVYFIIYIIHHYLDSTTLAFQNEYLNSEAGTIYSEVLN